jgi:type IV pilus assembly protein PilF
MKQWKKIIATLSLIVLMIGCASSPAPQAPTAYDFVMADVKRKSEQENVEVKAATVEKRASARVDVAMAQYQAGGYERAYLAAKEAISLDDRNVNAWIVLALSQEKLLYTAEDIYQSYESALQRFNSQVDLNHNYGWFLCRNKQEVKGMSYLTKASSSNQNTSPSRTFLVMSKCMLRLNPGVSAEYARKSLDTQPNWSEAWLSLGLAQAGTGYWNVAHESLLKYFEYENKPSAEAIMLALRVATVRNDVFHVDLYKAQLNKVAPHRAN